MNHEKLQYINFEIGSPKRKAVALILIIIALTVGIFGILSCDVESSKVDPDEAMPHYKQAEKL